MSEEALPLHEFGSIQIVAAEWNVEFLKRTRWKTYNKKGGRQIYGNYLTVIV
jgi:hypothetical protein